MMSWLLMGSLRNNEQVQQLNEELAEGIDAEGPCLV